MTTATATAPASAATGGTWQSKLLMVLRVTSGNFLEQFDFFLFGFYATYIAKVFFPTGSEFASLMLTFAVFGAGFLMRPLGAIVLGAYIDKVGRRKGLIVTLSIMAWGTLLIPCAGLCHHWSGGPDPCSDRATASGLLGWRGARRRIGLSRRDGHATPQGFLCRVAIGQPTGLDHACGRARLRDQRLDGARGH